MLHIDYEIRLLLNKLVVAIDELNSPDWWIIVLTTINIVAFILVAITQIRQQKQQTRLQAHQTKAEEYEIYRKLYHSIKRTNVIVDSFLIDIWNTVWPPSYHEPNIDILSKKQEDILLLHSELENNIIDFELKFSIDFFDEKRYYSILSVMYNILGEFIYLFNKNDDYWLRHKRLPEHSEQIEFAYKNNDDNGLIKILLEYIPEIGHNKCLKLGFDTFMTLKNEVHNDCIIEEIKKRCKID